MEGTGWLLPRAEPFQTKIKDVFGSVEEMGGTANLYSIADMSEAQEQRALSRFQQEREKEYAEILRECRKMLRRIAKERERGEFNAEEARELEHNLAKIDRWLAAAGERDFGDVPTRREVEELIW